MTVASEIQRIKDNIAGAYTSASNKGATLPTTQNSANLASCIDSITGGFTPTGNINITDTNVTDVASYATAQVVDANLIASNIKKNVSILGIDGSYEGSVTKDLIEITSTSVVDVTDYARAQVVDANLIASNIRKDVSVLGIVGTLDGGSSPTGTISITENGTVDVTNYATAEVNVPGISEDSQTKLSTMLGVS